MLNVFYRVLDIGIAALWMVIAVLILRLVFRKASSRVKCAMWGMVALRLLVPVIIESNFVIDSDIHENISLYKNIHLYCV